MNNQRLFHLCCNAALGGCALWLGSGLLEFNAPEAPAVFSSDGAALALSGVKWPAIIAAIVGAIRKVHGFHPDATKPLMSGATAQDSLQTVASKLAASGKWDELAVIVEAHKKLGAAK